MKNLFRTSITVKISLLVLGSTCLVLALILHRSHTSSCELIRQEAQQGALNLTSAVANEIEQTFLVVAESGEDLALYLESSTISEKTLQAHIRRMVRKHPKVYGATVAFLPFKFRPDAERYAPYFYKSAGGIRFEQLAKASYDYFRQKWFTIPVETERPGWSDPYLDEGGGGVVMTTYSHPLYGGGDGPAGKGLRAIVAADISLDYLNDLVNAIQLYQSGFCFVISNKGTIVTSYRFPERVMRSIFDLADESKHPDAPKLARAMISEESGFYDIGAGFTGEESYVAFTRIDPPGWTLCAVLPKKEVFAGVDVIHQETIALACMGTVLLLIAAVLVARSISRPLRRMASETLKVAQGDLDIDLSDIRSADEVGQLARSFTRMAEGLKERERIKDTFGRYVTQEVVKRLLESKDGLRLGGETREISIMMSDLRGFTALTSGMHPEQVITFLNRYLGKMVEIILDHRGIIDEIIGDGILAFFGAPEAVDNHPELAVACALHMQLAMDEINRQNERDGLPHLEMGIAVNTGEVVVGNIGSEKRAKYGAVGAQVNFTDRVESFTVGGQVLISEGAYEKLSGEVEISRTLDVQMKGVPGTVRLYDITGISGQFRARLPSRDDSPVRLPQPIEVEAFRMDHKILDKAGLTAVITHASLTSGTVLFQNEIGQWEDIRMILAESPTGLTGGQIYGKVVSVAPVHEGIQTVLRFTSVSPSAYRLLRELMDSVRSAGHDPGVVRK